MAHGFLKLLRSNILFVWDEQTQHIFMALIRALTSAPLISPPNIESNFTLYISRSTYSVARVLIQEDLVGVEHVIYYSSKKLYDPVMYYSQEGQLVLAVTFSVEKHCHYILTRTTKVVTNSNPMDFLLSR